MIHIHQESIIHNNCFLSDKVVWSESGEKSAQIKHRLQAKTALNKCLKRLDFDVMDFFTGGCVIMDYGLRI